MRTSPSAMPAFPEAAFETDRDIRVPAPARSEARRRQRGAALVEFALIFTLLIGLALGLMEFGRIVWSYHTLVHATREGLRVAMIRGTENPESDGEDLSDTISDAVKSRAIGLDPAKITVTPAWPGGVARGAAVQVQSTYNFEFVTGSFLSRNATIQLVSNSQAILLN